MTAGKIIGYISAAIFIIFGALFILAAFSPDGSVGYIFTGSILVLIGFGFVWFASRKTSASAGGQEGAVTGAPMVTCPFCKTNYQITEEPKW
jgi:Na+/melibiose symporter-like transporter